MQKGKVSYWCQAGGWGDIGRMILRAEMIFEFSSITSKTDEAIRLLAEAGARIAAEIDNPELLKKE